MLRLIDPKNTDWTFTPSETGSGRIDAAVTVFPQGADGWELGATTPPADPRSPNSSQGIFPASQMQSVFGNSGDTMNAVIRWTFLGQPVSGWSEVQSVLVP